MAKLESPFAKYKLETVRSIVPSFDFSKERIDIYQLINFTIKRGSFSFVRDFPRVQLAIMN